MGLWLGQHLDHWKAKSMPPTNQLGPRLGWTMDLLWTQLGLQVLVTQMGLWRTSRLAECSRPRASTDLLAQRQMMYPLPMPKDPRRLETWLQQRVSFQMPRDLRQLEARR